MTLSANVADLAPLSLTIGGAATVLPIGRAAVSPGLSAVLYEHGGPGFASSALFPGGVAGVTVPMPVGAALALLGVTAKRFTAGEVFLQTYADSLRQGGAANTSLVMGAGLAYIAGIQVRKGAVAIAQVNLLPFSADGVARPIDVVGSKTIPALTDPAPVLHTIGPVRVAAGSLLGGCNSLDLGMGARVEPLVHGDHQWPVDAVYGGGRPVARVGCDALLAMLARFDLGAASLTAVEFWLRANDYAGGALAATGLSLVASRAVAVPQPVELPLEGHGSQGVELHLLSTSTAHPLTYTASAAVPTT